MDLLSVLLAKQLRGNGSGDNVLLVNYNLTTYELNKTWQEIFDAVEGGRPCLIVDKQVDEVEHPYAALYFVTKVEESVSNNAPVYYVHAVCSDYRLLYGTWQADTPQDYPVFTYAA